jgi:hypothetical protein
MNGFTVLGIAMAGDTATAVIRGPGGAVDRIRPGEMEQGWRLVNVALDGLTFERNKERRVLMLVKNAPIVIPGRPGAARPGLAGAVNMQATMPKPPSDDSDDDKSDDGDDQ